ncbi:MAG: outer membrane protein assembly factor BamD [candidate division Zixibacteria bacterium]|nr:outer membrane protein assembly factor BamD [candidate division Zixibacteria bacterium]
MSRPMGYVCWMLTVLTVYVTGCAPPAPKPDWAAEVLYEHAMKRMEKKDWVRANEAFRMLTLNHSGSDLVDDALYYLGETHQKMNEHAVAVVTFKRLLRDFPQSPFADEAQYQLAVSIYEQSSAVQLTQDKTFEAIRELQIFLDEYPDSELAPKTNEILQKAYDKIAEKDYRIGHLYFRLSDWEAARLYLTEMVEEFPMSRWASYAQYKIAESYAREKKWDEAIQRYVLFIKSYPDHEWWASARVRLEEIRDYVAAERKDGAEKPAHLATPPDGSTPLTKNPPASTGGLSP